MAKSSSMSVRSHDELKALGLVGGKRKGKRKNDQAPAVTHNEETFPIWKNPDFQEDLPIIDKIIADATQFLDENDMNKALSTIQFMLMIGFSEATLKLYTRLEDASTTPYYQQRLWTKVDELCESLGLTLDEISKYAPYFAAGWCERYPDNAESYINGKDTTSLDELMTQLTRGCEPAATLIKKSILYSISKYLRAADNITFDENDTDYRMLCTLCIPGHLAAGIATCEPLVEQIKAIAFEPKVEPEQEPVPEEKPEDGKPGAPDGANTCEDADPTVLPEQLIKMVNALNMEQLQKLSDHVNGRMTILNMPVFVKIAMEKHSDKDPQEFVMLYTELIQRQMPETQIQNIFEMF